ncbi:hypothetical protein Y1Q_0021488 [Alligator mississippiensis]|uniref:Uncharacterized protein n=1 Tax=Alligator mississippiensis TaxID=8496 RepID=A0A151P9Z7_ALLMI|nr:hypothetical protein Y1Q_0021488 [Alligator mississippiensis]
MEKAMVQAKWGVPGEEENTGEIQVFRSSSCMQGRGITCTWGCAIRITASLGQGPAYVLVLAVVDPGSDPAAGLAGHHGRVAG